MRQMHSLWHSRSNLETHLKRLKYEKYEPSNFALFQSKGEANGHGFNFGLQYSFNNKGSLGVTLQNIKSGLNWKVKRGNKTK